MQFTIRPNSSRPILSRHMMPAPTGFWPPSCRSHRAPATGFVRNCHYIVTPFGYR